jgi:hypothetical protein
MNGPDVVPFELDRRIGLEHAENRLAQRRATQGNADCTLAGPAHR